MLELRKGNVEAARANFRTAQTHAPQMYEPFYNGALLAYNLGEFQEAFELAQKARDAFPDHTDTLELLGQLNQQLRL